MRRLTKHSVLLSAIAVACLMLLICGGGLPMYLGPPNRGRQISLATYANITCSGSADTSACSIAHTQIERLRNLHEQCDAISKPWWGGLDRLLVSDDLKTIYCAVPKVGSTVWKRTMALASGRVTDEEVTSWSRKRRPVRFRQNPSLVVHQDHFSKKVGVRPLSSYWFWQRQYRLDNYFTFLFVRNPFERFLSAFEDKFGTPGVRAHQKRLSYKANVPIENISFGLFAETYLRDGRARDTHWKQVAEMCLPCNIRYDFIGFMETFYEDAKYVVKHGWGSSLSAQDLFIPTKGPTSLRQRTSTLEKMALAYAQLEDSLVDDIRKSYQSDFVLFGYDPDQMFTQPE